MKVRWKTVLWHVLFWIVFMSIFTFIEGGYQSNFDDAFYLEASYLPLRLALVYFNYFFLAPRFLFNNKVEKYTAYTLLTIIIASFLQRLAAFYIAIDLIFPGWDPGEFWQMYRVVQAAMILTLPMIFLMGFTVVLRWFDSERKMQLLTQEKTATELKYLKSQINPHFFFNTLNNLYGLAQEKSDKTADVVLKLSHLMSYMLYEANSDIIRLDDEVEHIKNYIALEEQRYEDRFSCNLSIRGNIQSVRIPPMLILPFIENSFKHGINKESEGAWITIDLSVENAVLQLKVENSINKIHNHNVLTEATNGGLGIKNVQRRLELLYPNGFVFSYQEEKDKYVINLELELEKLVKTRNDA